MNRQTRFAKLFPGDVTQIAVIVQPNKEEGHEVRIWWRSERSGGAVRSLAIHHPRSEEGERMAEATFAEMTEAEASALIAEAEACAAG